MVQVQFESTSQIYVTIMTLYREICVWGPLGGLVLYLTKKDNRACVLHYRKDTIQERQS